MAKTSLTIFAAIQKEFFCDKEGKGFVSKRGLGRMCGKKSIGSWGKGGLFCTVEIDKYLTSGGIEVSTVDFSSGIPDYIAAEVIGFYAEEKQDPVAKQYSRAFRAIGLRKAIQEVVGYTSPEQKMYTIDMVVRRKPATWERMFSPSWVGHAEAITGWKWEWSVMGSFINDCVYSYLPMDVVGMLRDLNPKNEDGRGRVHKHHQFLQPEIREIVAKHLAEVEVLMNGAKDDLELFKLLMVNHYGRFRLSGEDEMPLFKTLTVYSPRPFLEIVGKS